MSPKAFRKKFLYLAVLYGISLTMLHDPLFASEKNGPLRTLPDKVVFDTRHLSLVAGDTIQLSWSFLPPETTECEVVFSSSIPEVASVDSNGILRALTPGMTLIRLTCPSGKSDELIVRVKAGDFTPPG